MKQLFLLFSHKLTVEQKEDARESLHVEVFVSLPTDLQTLWSDIPEDKDDIQNYLLPLKEYLKQYVKQGDFILIQGDFGGVYDMVNFSKTLGLIPIHSTTKRVVKERVINNIVQKTSTFRHVIYRRYI